MLKRSAMVLAIAGLVLAGSLGCALSDLVARAPTPAPIATRTPRPTFTATPVGTATPEVLPTATPVPPTPTPEVPPTPTAVPPTPTPEGPPTATPLPPTPTPEPIPVAIVQSDKVNVREGPGTAYRTMGQVPQGARLDIVGKNPAGDWWQVCCVNNQQAWIVGRLVTVEGAVGTVKVAANIPPPPPPTATPRPTATPVPAAPTATPAPQFPFLLVKGVDKCVSNPGQTYFDGFVRYANNNPRNGACVHIAYYGPRNTKCAGCDGVGAGVWGFSPFGGPAPAGTTVEIFVVQCPTSMPAGGQTTNTGFGELTPLSEKWTYTINESVECHGITFAGG